MSDALDRVLAGLPRSHAGAGGAVAVLRDGALLARHAWGWADLERRIPFTPATLFRICSISKQFTCATVLDHFPDPSVLDADIRALLPNLGDKAPRALHLCHNQSGLRDYWALTSLCGAPVEGEFTDAEARRLIAGTRSLQFEPGTRYSYCNQNFRMLGDIVSARAGRSFDELLHTGIFARAGMATARLVADTATMPDGTIGYEGSPESGLRAAVNRIHWTGDAGIAASLDDMIAWERWIDASRDDAGGLYARMAAPVGFSDMSPACYGFGLSRAELLGQPIIGHGGGLRGWRSFRFHAPASRISVVVLFNHMADPHPAARAIFASLLDHPAPPPPASPDPGWQGAYEEPETGLVARIEVTADQHLRLRFATAADQLDIAGEDAASNGNVRLVRTQDAVRMTRALDNLTTILTRCQGVPSADIEGVYHCEELDADFTCVAAGGVLSGAFSGFLGNGMMVDLLPVATDLWLVPCPRALDYAAPGDWTLRVRRDAAGGVAGVEIGCWLARGVWFARR